MDDTFNDRSVAVWCSALPVTPTRACLQVLWPLLTSHGSISRHRLGCLYRGGREISPGKHGFLRPISRRIYCQDLVQKSDFTVIRQLIRPEQPRMRFLYVDSGFCLGLSSDPPSRERPCLRLAVPSARPAGDLHPQESSKMFE